MNIGGGIGGIVLRGGRASSNARKWHGGGNEGGMYGSKNERFA